MTKTPQGNPLQAIAAWPYAILTLHPELQNLRNCIGAEQARVSTKGRIASVVKRVTGALGKRNWLLNVSGKSEAVICPDFCEKMPVSGQNLDAFWEAIDQNQRIHVVIPSSVPEQFAKALPPYVKDRPYSNVHLVAVLGDAQDVNARRIDALGKIPACSRGLWVGSNFDPVVLEEGIAGIDFIIAIGAQCITPSVKEQLSVRLREVCEKHDVALVQIPPAVDPTNGEGPLVLSYPFPREQASASSECEHLSGPCLKLGDTETEGKTCSPPANVVRRKAARSSHRRTRSSRPSTKPEESGAHGMSSVTPISVDPICAPLLELPIFNATEDRLERFVNLHRVVKDGIEAAAEAGLALMCIRDEKLWRDAGHRSWNSFCDTLLELSRSYVNRLISHAAITQALGANDPPAGQDGKPILPTHECQTRPLKKLPAGKKRANAWRRAVERAGGIPTAKIVTAVVAEIHPNDVPKLATSRGAQRQALIKRLREVANARSSWDDVVQLVADIQALN